MLPPIRQQRKTEGSFKGLLRMRNSKMTAKTGEVKERTMRSPMGMRGMEASTEITALDIKRP